MPGGGVGRSGAFALKAGLRGRLIAVFLLAVAPHLLIDVVQIGDRYREVGQGHTQASQELAFAWGASFLNFVESLWDVERTWGAVVAREMPQSPERVEAFFRFELAHRPEIATLSWHDAAGQPIVTVHRDPPDLDRPTYRGIIGPRYLSSIVSGKDRSMSPILLDSSIGAPYFGISRGIYENGRLYGIVAALVDFSRLDPPASGQLGSDFVGLVDPTGRAIQAAKKADSFSPFVIVDGFSDLLSEAERLGSGYSMELDGERWIGSEAPIGGLGWTAFAHSPAKAVYARAWSTAVRHALAVSAAMFVGILLMFLATRGVYESVRAIQDAAAALGQGDFGARVELGGSDALAAAADSFDAMANRIQELEDSRSRLVYATVHELRDPLASAKAIVQLARMRSKSGLSAGQCERYFATIDRELGRIADFIMEFLDAYRVRQGTLDVHFQRVDFVQVVADALGLALANEEVGAPGVEFDREGDGPMFVNGDARRLEQVVRNLVRNGLKYSPVDETLRLRLRLEEDTVVLSVSDKGPGIPSDELPRIFESFFQGSNHPIGDGMGLGLFICRDIVCRHEGEIWIESQVGQGTTVNVKLPLWPEEETHDGEIGA